MEKMNNSNEPADQDQSCDEEDDESSAQNSVEVVERNQQVRTLSLREKLVCKSDLILLIPHQLHLDSC